MLQQRSEFWFIIVVTREVGLAVDERGIRSHYSFPLYLDTFVNDNFVRVERRSLVERSYCFFLRMSRECDSREVSTGGRLIKTGDEGELNREREKGERRAKPRLRGRYESVELVKRSWLNNRYRCESWKRERMKLLMLYPRGSPPVRNRLINNSIVSPGFVVKIERDASFCPLLLRIRPQF